MATVAASLIDELDGLSRGCPRCLRGVRGIMSDPNFACTTCNGTGWPIMTARDIADAVVKQPPTDARRFEKLARLVVTQAKLDAVVALLPEDMRASVVAGMAGKVS